VVYEQLFPIFKKENSKAETMMIPMSEEGANFLMDEVKRISLFKMSIEALLSGELPEVEEIKAKIEDEFSRKRYQAIDIPDKFWDMLKVSTQLVVTGESVNLEKRIGTLTNLYNTLSKTNPPAAEKVLAKILSLTGESYDALTGVKPAQAQNQMLQGTGMPQGNGQMAGKPAEDALMGQITNEQKV
jgi:RNAse (barnase) inhibitor barstar